MLNLFRLPFRGKKNVPPEGFPFTDISLGIVRNYLRGKGPMSEERMDVAIHEISSEIESLRFHLENAGNNDRYDIIQNALHRIDKKLSK
ncbi:MAG TPA: hypothetical protein ENJ95_07855 [Bacteroidetes bacterium]|nr:hypothetical protein [Bacteroidota bacterium]